MTDTPEVNSINGISRNMQCDELSEPQPIFAAIIIALIVIGLFGNCLVFFIIMVLREYKKSITNWYILQLTLADTLFLLMLPFTAHSEIVGYWNFGLSLCKFKEAVIFINYYASIYFLVIMSFDRYLAVTKAFASNSWVLSLRSPTASYIISIVGWILSALLCIQLYQYSQINRCGACIHEFPQGPTGSIPECLINGTNCPPNDNTDLTYESNIPEIEEPDYSGRDYDGVITRTQILAWLSQYIEESSRPVSVLEIENIIESFNLSENEKEALLKSLNLSGTAQISNKNNEIFLKNLQNLDNKSLCSAPTSRKYLIWIYGNFVGAFILPFLLICFFYGKIMKKIMNASTFGDNVRQRSYRRRVTMIVIALVTLFAISWLPWFVEKLVKINGIDLSLSNCIHLTNAVRAFAYLNSALNPYFYSFLGFHFRERLRQAKNRVRLPSSLRSKATFKSRFRHRKNTTSNSAGSIQGHQNALPLNTNHDDQEKTQVDVKFSMTNQRTEKTVI